MNWESMICPRCATFLQGFKSARHYSPSERFVSYQTPQKQSCVTRYSKQYEYGEVSDILYVFPTYTAVFGLWTLAFGCVLASLLFVIARRFRYVAFIIQRSPLCGPGDDVVVDLVSREFHFSGSIKARTLCRASSMFRLIILATGDTTTVFCFVFCIYWRRF